MHAWVAGVGAKPDGKEAQQAAMPHAVGEPVTLTSVQAFLH